MRGGLGLNPHLRSEEPVLSEVVGWGKAIPQELKLYEENS